MNHFTARAKACFTLAASSFSELSFKGKPLISAVLSYSLKAGIQFLLFMNGTKFNIRRLFARARFTREIMNILVLICKENSLVFLPSALISSELIGIT